MAGTELGQLRLAGVVVALALLLRQLGFLRAMWLWAACWGNWSFLGQCSFILHCDSGASCSSRAAVHQDGRKAIEKAEMREIGERGVEEEAVPSLTAVQGRVGPSPEWLGLRWVLD